MHVKKWDGSRRSIDLRIQQGKEGELFLWKFVPSSLISSGLTNLAACPCRPGCAVLGPAASRQLTVPPATSSTATRERRSGAEELAGKQGNA